MHIDVCSLIADTLAGPVDEGAIEFEGRWTTRGEIKCFGERLTAALDLAGVPVEAPVALIVRNRAVHAAVMLAMVSARRSISMIYAFQSPQAIAQDIVERRAMALIADEQDWSEAVLQAARQAGAIGLAISGTDGFRMCRVADLPLGSGPFRDACAEPSVEVLSSGTTGAPKCLRMEVRKLVRSLSTAMGGTSRAAPTPLLATFPFGGIGGLGSVIASGCTGVPLILLEKFSVEAWVSAVKRNRLQRAGGPAVAYRMLLDAKVPPEDLASLRYMSGGASPLDPELQDLFEQTYGVQILWAYGATEFAGTAAAWTPALREEFGPAKRGSAGRPLADVSLRIVNADTGAEQARGTRGLLEVKVPVIQADWIRTTDLASIDEDGFLFVHGRADGAIMRGGFKIIPETINAVLRQHPAIGDAVTVGLPDARLGHVPVVAIELRPDAQAPSSAELLAHVRAALPAHHIPVDMKLVPALPRTASMKVDLRAVAGLFAMGGPGSRG